MQFSILSERQTGALGLPIILFLHGKKFTGGWRTQFDRRTMVMWQPNNKKNNFISELGPFLCWDQVQSSKLRTWNTEYQDCLCMEKVTGYKETMSRSTCNYCGNYALRPQILSHITRYVCRLCPAYQCELRITAQLHNHHGIWTLGSRQHSRPSLIGINRDRC